MNDPTHPDYPPPVLPSRSPWRRRLFLGGFILLLVMLLPGWMVYQRLADDWDVQNAAAEADRVDPGWRFENLEGGRAEIPDDENGALVVLAAHKLLPRSWLPVPPPPDPGLGEVMPELLPVLQLDEKQTKDLRAALGTAAPALKPARQLVDFPRGRFVVSWSSDFIGTLMPHAQEVREVAQLLTLDAALRAHDSDVDGALESARAAVNAGRSLGDEPTEISQLVRRACSSLAVRSAERALGQGEPSGPALEQLQHLMEDEATQPSLLIAMRSARIGMDGALKAFKAGKFNYQSYGIRLPVLLPAPAMSIVDATKARGAHAPYLRYTTELVEIAKLPLPEQKERLKRLHKPDAVLPAILTAFMEGGDDKKILQIFHRHQALLDSIVAALAVERYRRDKGHWPETLADLVPDYLPKVPLDLYDGAPLRYRQLDDGVVVYSVGPDGQDDGGKIVRRGNPTSDADIGVRLWDVAHRRQPAPPPPPPPETPQP
jgi:hypothetical protein